MTRKPETPQEQWKAIVDFAQHDDALDVAEESHAEVDASLRAAGLDPEAVGKRGVATVEKALREMEEADGIAHAAPAEPEPVRANVVPIGRGRVRAVWTLQLVAAAIVALLAGSAGVAYVMRDRSPRNDLRRPEDHWQPRAPEVPPTEVAWQLRQDATEACARWQWAACLAKLDEAKRVDPDGEGASPVQLLRETLAAVTVDGGFWDGGKDGKRGKDVTKGP